MIVINLGRYKIINDEWHELVKLPQELGGRTEWIKMYLEYV